jgi:hypothetical protein
MIRQMQCVVMKSCVTWLLTVWITLLAGCSPLSSQAVPSPEIQAVTEARSTSASSSPSATVGLSPAPTHLLPTLTMTSMQTLTPEPPTPIPLPLHSFDQRCATVQSSLPSGFLAAGMIFLVKDAYPKSTIYRLDAQNPVLQTLPSLPGGGDFKVSPDWNHLAYGTSDTRLLVLAPTGEIQASQPWNDRWNDIQAWLDPQRLIMIHKDKDPIAVNAFNPFTGAIETLNPGLDDIYGFSIETPGPHSWFIWKLVYDSSLTRLVYLRDYRDLNEMSMVMIDLDTRQILWEYKSPQGAYFFIPNWSPDGRQLAFVSAGYSSPLELFTVNLEGHEIHWIDMPEDLGISSQLYWSPNGQYIAFNGSKSLYVLDTETHQVIDYCIPWTTGLDKSLDGPYPNIFWSPDSRQLIYQRFDAPALVVDLASGVAAPIVENTSIRPIGWLSQSE